jgi:hypothetical protein
MFAKCFLKLEVEVLLELINSALASKEKDEAYLLIY